MDGASAVLYEIFGDAGRHTRSAIGVGGPAPGRRRRDRGHGGSALMARLRPSRASAHCAGGAPTPPTRRRPRPDGRPHPCRLIQIPWLPSFYSPSPRIQERPPARWRRKPTFSHAAGKCPSEEENTRPRPSVKHHDRGKPNVGRTTPRAVEVEFAVVDAEQDPGVGAQVAELVHLVVPAPGGAEVAQRRVVGLADLQGDVLRPRVAVEAGADQRAVVVPAVAAVGGRVDGEHPAAAGPHPVEERGPLGVVPRRLADREQGHDRRRRQVGGGEPADVVGGDEPEPGRLGQLDRPRWWTGRARRAPPRVRRGRATPGSRRRARPTWAGC